MIPSSAQRLCYNGGILPNLRNVPVYFYTGLADENCEPGTFLYAWDRIQELREADPGGYVPYRVPQDVPMAPGANLVKVLLVHENGERAVRTMLYVKSELDEKSELDVE